jgi:hypothetical protein
MAYQVVLADSAKADANRVCRWMTSEAPLHGPRWVEALIVSLYSLQRLPFRCPLAREAELAKPEIRCLLFGKHREVSAFFTRWIGSVERFGSSTLAMALASTSRQKN